MKIYPMILKLLHANQISTVETLIGSYLKKQVSLNQWFNTKDIIVSMSSLFMK
jgi:hypothetical protein